MHSSLDREMSRGIILVLMAAAAFGLASATISVQPGDSIQSAIDSVGPGQIIEVQNGTYFERINLTKTLYLKGLGNPVIDASGEGSAITISAGSSTLVGFTATGSGRGVGDAGIRVLSNGNIIKDNKAIKNNNFGIILYQADKNTVFWNTAIENSKGGILLVHSDNNQIWSNSASQNGNGISVETSRGNAIYANRLTRNDIGITISNYNFSESIVESGKSVSIKYGSSSQVPVYTIGEDSEPPLPTANTLYDNILQDNGENAFDDGHNNWDNDTAGNHYSNYDSREQGCTDRNRDGICDLAYQIPGGNNEDRWPKASADAILSYRSRGLLGSELKIDHINYLPGSDIDVAYASSGNFSGWVGIMRAGQTGAAPVDALSYQSLPASSGTLRLAAPDENGSYDIRMYSSEGKEMTSLGFAVGIPTITATPASLSTCEQITVSYSGAPGYENDWIAMYKSDSDDGDYTARQYLDGNENGTIVLDATDPGSYNFRMFENDSSTRLATSNSVEAKEFTGRKVVASPSHVAPGGTVTVTYWGAPASGTGIIGMYGVNRPDKFSLGKRALGSKNCGRITWQLPYEAGQYDFRMFYSDITSEGQGAYQLLGQSNVVTVG